MQHAIDRVRGWAQVLRSDAEFGHLARLKGAGTAKPSLADLFSPLVYDVGAMVLHALRLDVGDDVFFRILQQWVIDHHDASATTDDFIAESSKVAGRDLGAFLHTWLESVDPPAYPARATS